MRATVTIRDVSGPRQEATLGETVEGSVGTDGRRDPGAVALDGPYCSVPLPLVHLWAILNLLRSASRDPRQDYLEVAKLVKAGVLVRDRWDTV